MFNEAGLAAILQFGALGLLGFFLYKFDQRYQSQVEFQHQMTLRIITVIEKNTSAHQQAALRSQAICTSIEMNRKMDNKEHEALMDQHKILTEDHRHITKKLASV